MKPTRALVALLLSVALAAVPVTAQAQERTSEVIGYSVQGKPIVAKYRGPADPAHVIVVLGSMHGLEIAGERVIKVLESRAVPPGVGMWLIPTMNPDGRGRQRENARGVDLNRNFPGDWRAQGRQGIPKWSGRGPASEPETRAVTRFMTRVSPDALISFHQPFGVVDLSHRRARPAAIQLAKDMRLPARVVNCSGPCRGTLTGWVDRELEGIAITVELPSRVSKGLITRSARGVLRLAEGLGR
jgi:murein peptide amidase A